MHPRRSAAAPPSVASSWSSARCSRPGGWWVRPVRIALWVGIGAVIWILTVAVISPIIGKPVLVACRALFGRLFGAPGRLAGENALRDPRRTGATASALMIGLALVSTIGVLAASMNKSIDDLVDDEFTADYLVQSVNFMPFSTTVGDALEDVDGVSTRQPAAVRRRQDRRRERVSRGQRRRVHRRLRPRGRGGPGRPARAGGVRLRRVRRRSRRRPRRPDRPVLPGRQEARGRGRRHRQARPR